MKNDRVAGRGGCNRYFAGITEGGPPGEVSIGPVGATRMACPEEVMEVESRYLGALESVVRYGFLAGKLALTYGEDDAAGVLLFTPREPAPERSLEEN